MQKIARIHVANYGAQNAWYDGLTFSFNDADTGQPCDAVINLENGGGKTTLLGFVFSCFETRQEKFLKHMQDRNHRFAEYFSKDGSPGFIVMEWSMPPRFAGGGPYRLVIGQVVAVRSAAEREEVERQFFAFEATSKLNFESVPAPGLGADNPAHTMAEFLKWMHAAGQISADFFHTRIQDDWQKHLVARSIDLDMLRLQVEFSAQEGGIDASFLTFHNEGDFLRKFFGLTLDTEKCAAVRQVVVAACDTLRKKPVLERRLNELTRLSAAMKPFFDAAGNYEAAREARAALEQTAAALRAALLAKAVSDESAMSAHAQAAQSEETRMASSAKRAKGSQARALTLRRLQLQRALYDAEALQQKAEQDARRAELELRMIEGARALIHVEEMRTRVAELQTLEEAEREGLKPARMQAEIQGALLRCALQREEERLSELSRSAANRETAAQQQLQETREASQKLNERVNELNREQGALQGDESRFVTMLERLRKEGLMLEPEGRSAVAIERLNQVLAEGLDAQAQADRDEKRSLEAERSHRAVAEAARVEADGHRRGKLDRETFVAKGEGERERLSQLAVLRAAVEAEVADPDSPAVLVALERLRSSDETAIATANVRLAELESNNKAIEATGVAGRSRDVDAVVGRLLAEGIRSARPFNTYLADALDDAGRSRALVLNDPARFLGVAVASGEFQNAKVALNKKTLKLSRPVVVSQSALESPDKHSESLVLGPEDDAAYNRNAALAYAARLEKAIADVRSELKAYQARNEEAVAAKEQLRAYAAAYGRSRLDQARAEIDRLDSEAVAASERSTEETAAAEMAATDASNAKSRIGELGKRCSEVQNHLRRLQDFQIEHEAPRPARLEQLKQIKQELQVVEKKRATLAEEGELAEKGQRGAYEERVQVESDAKNAREERGAIALYDAKYPADQALTARPMTVGVLRRLYIDAKSTLETAERERLGVLAEKLRTAREASEAAQKDFSAKYANLDVNDLAQRKITNFEAAISNQEHAVEVTKNADREARKKHTESETALGIFQEQNREVVSASAEMEILKDSELARHLLRAEQDADRARMDIVAAEAAARDARAKRDQAQEAAALSKRLVRTLAVALTIPDQIVVTEPATLENDISEQVDALIARGKAHSKELDEVRRKAEKAFSNLTRAASIREFQEAEPELSAQFVSNEFDAACADRSRLCEGLAERIATTEESIGRMKEDFESCVVELHVLASNGIHLLSSATTGKRVPEAAPYVGGKPVLKMRANFSHVQPEVRRDALRRYLDSLIDSSVVPAKGSDLVAECILRMYGKPLGLQVLKMVPDEDQQYVSVDQLKNSGGEGVTMAMFLYLVINQLRSETHAKLKKAGGGPLILDNPFAKATTPTLWRAQRLLAEAMDVQLIFATALPDYNTLGEFRRFIRLRKAGKNQKTGRWHLEHADLTLNEPAEQFT